MKRACPHVYEFKKFALLGSNYSRWSTDPKKVVIKNLMPFKK